MNGERSLWASVIQLAIDDAQGNGRGLSRNRAHAEMRHARLWLTKPNNDFNEVCQLAGVDPVAVRERCHRMFPDEPTTTNQPKRTSAVTRYSNARLYSLNGQSMTLAEWSAMCGHSVPLLHNRMKRGMTFAQAVTTPKLSAGMKWREQVTAEPAPGGGYEFVSP